MFGGMLLFVTKPTVDEIVAAVLPHCASLRVLIFHSKMARAMKNVNDHLPTWNCPELVELRIPGCLKLSDQTLQKLLRQCPQLAALDLRNCKRITDQALRYIGDEATATQNLKSVKLAACAKVTDRGVVRLCKTCLSLETVDLRDCLVSGPTMKAMTSLKKLRCLDIRHCRVANNQQLKHLANACSKQLEELHMEWMEADLNLAVVDFSESCPNLKTVEVNGDCLQTDSIVTLVRNCRSLMSLTFTGASQVEPLAINAIAEYCANTLQVLNIEGCKQGATDATLSTICTRCTKLRTLIVWYCTKLTGNSLDDLHNLTELTTLQIGPLKPHEDGTPATLNEAALLNVARSCPKITELTFQNCGVTDQFLVACSGLRYLSDLYVPESDITDVGISAVVQGPAGKLLKRLVINSCTKITPKGFDTIAASCSMLGAFHAAFCPGLTLPALTALAENCPYLKTVDATDAELFSVAELDNWKKDWPNLVVFKREEWEPDYDVE
eukprot:TRINITY_DN60243_c0_g1_i1.p1 TRINITY_DN60243_c0_g1~~TRINITY_DN60243_c0_g1_i1.p1  ORF type:complete len:581 (-),score=25.34 TRINITY_DN60243_c0_g1_i1:282-1772(-)